MGGLQSIYMKDVKNIQQKVHFKKKQTNLKRKKQRNTEKIREKKDKEENIGIWPEQKNLMSKRKKTDSKRKNMIQKPEKSINKVIKQNKRKKVKIISMR